MVEASRAAVVGLRDVDPAERGTVKASGIGAFTMRDIDERGMRAVMEQAIQRATTGTAGIHVSFDLDGIDPDSPPASARRRRAASPTARPTSRWRCWPTPARSLSAELVEVNPILDQQNGTARLGVELLCSLLGKKIL